jgi:hypothetical protein
VTLVCGIGENTSPIVQTGRKPKMLLFVNEDHVDIEALAGVCDPGVKIIPVRGLRSDYPPATPQDILVWVPEPADGVAGAIWDEDPDDEEGD